MRQGYTFRTKIWEQHRVVLNDPYTALQMYQCSLAHTQNPVQQKDVLRRIEEIEREINI